MLRPRTPEAPAEGAKTGAALPLTSEEFAACFEGSARVLRKRTFFALSALSLAFDVPSQQLLLGACDPAAYPCSGGMGSYRDTSCHDAKNLKRIAEGEIETLCLLRVQRQWRCYRTG